MGPGNQNRTASRYTVAGENSLRNKKRYNFYDFGFQHYINAQNNNIYIKK